MEKACIRCTVMGHACTNIKLVQGIQHPITGETVGGEVDTKGKQYKTVLPEKVTNYVSETMAQ